MKTGLSALPTSVAQAQPYRTLAPKTTWSLRVKSCELAGLIRALAETKPVTRTPAPPSGHLGYGRGA